MMTNTRTIDRILASRGALNKRETDEAYAAFQDSGGQPQMGFSIHRRGGDMDGFLYHNIDNVSLRTRRGSAYLSFTHRGKAVTLKGIGLEAIYQALMAHTLVHIFEHPERALAPDGEAPRVDRVLISLISEKAPQKRRSEEKP